MHTVLVAAGIYLSSRIISFLAGELTEHELKKQREIDEQINRVLASFEQVDSNDTKLSALKESRTLLEKKKKLYDYLISEANSKKTELSELYDEIKESKKTVVSALRTEDSVHTPLRRSSLELLIRQLCEAQAKCLSYMKYLESYCVELGFSSGDNPACFCMRLPSDYPYVGKIIWINSHRLKDDCFEIEIPNMHPISVRVTDAKSYDLVDNQVLPVMITDIKRGFYASLEKGQFKEFELTNTHLGCSATVETIRSGYVVLKYHNELEMILRRDNLIKPNRIPPVRASLTVYPVKWEYDLDYYISDKGFPVEVSERREDAGSALSFNCFPICFTPKDLELFWDYYEKNNLAEYDEEFLIGPVDLDNVSLKKGTKLKLQFGSIPLFYIEIDEFVEKTNGLRFYFRFSGLCKPEEKTFSADDIFLPFDVSFSPYFDGTSDEKLQQIMEMDDIADVSALIWDLFEEFRIQEQIRRNREGMGYFFKWEKITDQLISLLNRGESIQLDVSWDKPGIRNTVFADVVNPERLERFIRQYAESASPIVARNWKPKYFVQSDGDLKFDTTIVDGGRRLKIVGKNVAEELCNRTTQIELFAINHPYPEYRQKDALRKFRTGQVVNPEIQAVCLNGASIISRKDMNCVILPFHNRLLNENASQRLSIECAIKEKDIFLIQGPPGTGKTTVIRELIEQVLDTSKDARVLIVSQANVAVDNALSGLIETNRDQIVRCGDENKVSGQLKNLCLQNKCQEYMDALEQRKEEFDEQFFTEWQKTILPNDSDDYSPVLCELIIRNHRLIGSTCVGLSKRNLGLERTEFDLVIIDEAGKALPAEILIPLLKARKAVLIGDHRQLPPVINPLLYDEDKIDLEERAISENDLFCHSFFERLYDKAPDSNKSMLDTQYRMPAVIGTVISNLFYDGKLKNGAGTDNRKPILFSANLTFINFDNDRSYREIKKKDESVINESEALAAVSLVVNIRKRDQLCSIAVITPYKGQKETILNACANYGISTKKDKVSVETIDSFQGCEADVVVFCTTRATRPTLFFRDSKRLNVALSRVKRELIILGKLEYFYKYKTDDCVLPLLADYIKTEGNIIESRKCALLDVSSQKVKKKEVFISLSKISLSSTFYLMSLDRIKIQSMIDDYCRNGDFISPLMIKKTRSGYLLEGQFEQYQAARDLDVEECRCIIIE